MTWAHPWRGCNLVGCSPLREKVLLYMCVGDISIYIQYVSIETKNLRGNQSVSIYASEAVQGTRN